VAASPISQASPEASRPKLDVPYVPTPESVVAKMLELAKVNKNDVVYDLGSGDGRIVITAAQKHGARGVGYDIDPQRIKEANANAQTAGVTDRVRFVLGDLFQADLSEASVVTLYLLPEINLKLRPKLLKELKPGTRIVSHNYGLGDWDPIRTETVETGTGEHLVFYWVVPPKGTHPN
jgi:predicted O-methyltransferase YrrM